MIRKQWLSGACFLIGCFGLVMPQPVVGIQSAKNDFAFQRQLDRQFAITDVDSSRPSARASHTAFSGSGAIARALGDQFLNRITAARNAAPGPRPGATLQDTMKQAMMTVPKVGVCSAFMGVCDNSSIYRTADGSCNNLNNPTWGMSNTPQRRYLIPQYNDGIRSPRTRGVFGDPLPSARLVSTTVHAPDDKAPQMKFISQILTQWGLFLTLDITSTPIRTGLDGRPLTCCPEELPPLLKGILDTALRDGCFPIEIPLGDRFFRRRCMHFPRSIQVENPQCTGVPAEQLNQRTAYIDASPLYGTTAEEAAGLRAMVDGLLKTSMGVSSIQTIFMREHNRTARSLKKINPHWNDERLFQETRRIIGAIVQKITYNHFLPLVLNKFALAKYKLGSPKYGYYNVYSRSTDASIVNAFSTAALRFGHSIPRSVVSRVRPDFSTRRFERLFWVFLKTGSSDGEAVGEYVRGELKDRANPVDRFMSTDLTDRLFLVNNNSLDLAAFNIQRGRDHGLPGYSAFRQLCGLPGVYNFRPSHGGLVDHDPHTARLLESVYKDPEDIDLFTGGVSEKPIEKSLVGPLFTCLLGRQFSALKRGDRFWYELSDPVTRFTPDQLLEIRKTSLSRIVCDNTNTFHIQRDAFRLKSASNPHVPCYSLPGLDLTKWREQQPQWSSWSAASDCSPGVTFQFRKRTCIPEGGGCRGPREMRRKCPSRG
ncbi:salivary peroxidase/catechol oxidase-like [Haliotis cracherodii]|uniref:salivary peroxidase/catechol oxidase-like n=1 Tax=Haliotis cracherodii TaxID=6455 RepID=UPI0039EA287B